MTAEDIKEDAMTDDKLSAARGCFVAGPIATIVVICVAVVFAQLMGWL